MSDKRVFLTKWLGDAWDTMMNQKHSSIKLAFIQCGVLNAIDGSEDNLITWPSRDLEVAYTVEEEEPESEEEESETT